VVALSLIGGPAITWAGPPEPTEAAPAPEVAPATEPTTAVEWYARGIELASAGQYGAAAEAFLRSYDLQRTPEALFNAAFAYEKAGATLPAISTYERFLAEPAPTQQYIEPARRSIEALTRTLGVLKGVRYDPERPPAQLFVQGEPVELDAFPLLVTPGDIEIEVVDEQGQRAHETYDVLAGEALVIDVRALLPAIQPEQVDEPVDVVADSDAQRQAAETRLEAAREHTRRAASLRRTTWIALALTGSTAIAAGTFGGLALREKQLYDEQTCLQFEGMNCPPDWSIGDPQRHWQLYRSHAITGTVLASISGALAIGTLVVGLVSVRHQRASRLVRVRPSLGGLVLHF
jgi:tetratricopeptide (TPR) repeat protein